MLKVVFYDNIKNFFMPYDARKYKGADYYWRAAASGMLCMGTSTLITYPLDLIHTRLSTDLTKKGQPRLYTTTFECFSRTNIDEGRKGLYKGLFVTLFASLLRGALTLPIYDVMKNQRMTSNDTLLDRFWLKLGPSVATSIAVSLLLYPFDTVKRGL